MPFLPDDQPKLPIFSTGYTAKEPEPAPSGELTIAAAFRRENTIGSAIAAMNETNKFEPDGYNAFEDKAMVNSKYLQNHREHFVGIRSSMEAEVIRQRIDREEEDRKLVDSAGFAGTVASIGAGVFDPTFFLPGGAFYRAGRIGQRVGKSVLSVGAAGGVGATAGEGMLHSSQLTRTAEESGYAIAGGVVLGGFLGAGVGLLPAKVRARIESELDGKSPPQEHITTIGGDRYNIDGTSTLPPVDISTMKAAASTPVEGIHGFKGVRREGDNLPEWHGDVQNTLDNLASNLGFETRPLVYVGEHGRAGGLASSDGWVIINSRLSREEAINASVHEFGHQVQTQRFNGLVDLEKKEIVDAYNAFTASKNAGGQPLTLEQIMPVSSQYAEAARKNVPTAAKEKYLNSFNEWFAEQVSRWITTSKEPVSVVDKFFNGIAETWAKIYQSVIGHVPLSKEVDAFMRKNWRGDKAPVAGPAGNQISALNAGALYSKIGATIPQGRFGTQSHLGGQKLSVPQSISIEQIRRDLGADVRGTLIEGPNSIKAFHGTPHDFDKFSLEKIGTGEGAQAYGHGLYFAEKRGIAEEYRNKLSRDTHGEELFISGKEFEPNNATHQAAAELFEQEGNRIDSIRRFRDRLAREDGGPYTKIYEEAISILESNKSLPEVTTTPGSLYEVHISAKPEQFLDWDAPRDKQPEILRGWAERNHPDIWEKSTDGASFYKLLKNKNMPQLPKDPEGTPSGWGFVQRGTEGQPFATEELRKVGIVGIRYLDGSSRKAGKGSRNYVVFDDSIIQIVSKNGEILKKPVPVIEFLRGESTARFSEELKTAGVKLNEIPDTIMRQAEKYVNEGERNMGAAVERSVIEREFSDPAISNVAKMVYGDEIQSGTTRTDGGGIGEASQGRTGHQTEAGIVGARQNTQGYGETGRAVEVRGSDVYELNAGALLPPQAAVAAPFTAKDSQLVNRLGSGMLAKISAFMTPLLRSQTTRSKAVREEGAKFFDPAGMRFEANTKEGGFRPMAEGAPVEVRINANREALLGKFKMEMDDVYAGYWAANGGSGGIAGKVGQSKNTLQRMLGSDGGPMTPTEFFENVGRAIDLDDAASADEFTKKAASGFKKYIAEVVEMLPEELRPDLSSAPKFAGGYLPTILNGKKIAAEMEAFEDLAFASMKRDQDAKFALQTDAARASNEMKLLSKEESKLVRRAATVSERMKEVETRMEESGLYYRRGEKRLEDAKARAFEMNSEITYLESQLFAAKGDKNAVAGDLKEMEKELRVLRKAYEKELARSKVQPEAPQVEPTEYKRAPRSEGGTVARVIEYMTGKRGRPPDEPRFIDWVISQGGMKDDGGDVRAIFGKTTVPEGLINPNGKNIDDLAQNLAEHYGNGKVQADFEDSIFEYLADSRLGLNPPEWRKTLSQEYQTRLNEYETAQFVREQMSRDGFNAVEKSEIIAYMRGEDPHGMAGKPSRPHGSDDDFIYADVPIDPVQVYRSVDDGVAGGRKDVKAAERIVADLRKKLAGREKVEARAIGKGDEAEVNAKAARSRSEILLDRAEKIQAQDDLISKELEKIIKSKNDLRNTFERIVNDWDGDTTKSAKSAIQRRAKQEAERQQAITDGTYKGRNERLRGADADIDDAIKDIVKSERQKTDEQLREQARDLAMNIISNPEGRMAYEWGDTATKESRAAMQSRGDGEIDAPSLKARKMPIDRADLAPYKDNDIRSVFHSYASSLIAQAEVHRTFGDVSASSAIRAIKDDYGEMLAAAKTPKERMKLQKEMNRDISDFAGMRDRILGIYALPTNPDSLFHRGATVARDWNFISLMGMRMISSVVDVGGISMRNGLGKSFEALGDALGKLSKDPALQNISRIEREILQDSGIALQMVNGSRAMNMQELMSDFSRVSKFEKGMKAAVETTDFINGAKLWDDGVQTVAGIATMRRMMRTIEDLATGAAVHPREQEWLASLNIGKPQADRIWAAAKAGTNERSKGVLMPEGRTWADKEAYNMFRYGLKQMVDSTILKPGQDRPFWMSTATGKVIGQFRGFTISAHQRVLLSGLQQADAKMVSGAITMVSMGMLSVALSDLARDGKLKDRKPGEWLVEGFDKSGIGGWFMEANNVVEKVSGQNFGGRVLAGQEPATRMVNMSKADALLGPTLGFVTDATRMAGVPFRVAADVLRGEPANFGDLSHGDIKAMRNRVMWQNHFLFRQPLNALQDSLERSMGIEPPPKKE